MVGQATPEQIEAWKAEHGEVFAIIVEDSVLYVRKPTRKDLSYASASAKNGGLDYIEALMKNCKLGGDETIITDDGKRPDGYACGNQSRYNKKALDSARISAGEYIRKADVQLRYYLHVEDPESLDDQEWAMRVRDLEWIREDEKKRQKA